MMNVNDGLKRSKPKTPPATTRGNNVNSDANSLSDASDDAAGRTLIERLLNGDHRKCPFDGPTDIQPNQPCPVCGDRGDDFESHERSNCVASNNYLLHREAAAFIANAIGEGARQHVGNSTEPRVDAEDGYWSLWTDTI